MKVVILCGGKGTRLREETEFRPKPMLPIGRRPILWHIMKTYACHGHTEFILCLGYKGEMIKEYFRNYSWNTSDVTLSLGAMPEVQYHTRNSEADWKVTLADTGEDSMTAYRIRMIERFLGSDETFLLTYGDGVGDIDISGSIDQHLASKKICTLTAVHPPGRFGELSFGEDFAITGFNEKPQTEEGYINAGYMVCSRRLFEFLPPDPEAAFEEMPLQNLKSAGQLGAFRHEGFWQPMDTVREFNLLNELWSKGRAPWNVWGDPAGS
jgi:glucose-1-phosphate cytidylyltransferase